jgi:hypothetical protein
MLESHQGMDVLIVMRYHALGSSEQEEEPAVVHLLPVQASHDNENRSTSLLR